MLKNQIQASHRLGESRLAGVAASLALAWSVTAAAVPAGVGSQNFLAGPNDDTGWHFDIGGGPHCAATPCFSGRFTPEGGQSVIAGYIQVGGAYFPAQPSAQYAAGDNGRTYTLGPAVMSGLNVRLQYKFFGDRRLARTLVILSNPSMSDITTTVGALSTSYVAFGVRATSSGDTLVTPADRWVVTSDNAMNPPDRPVITYVSYGPGMVAVTPNQELVSGRNHFVRHPVTVPAGATRAFMFFTGLDNLVGGMGGGTNEAAIASTALWDDSGNFEMEGLLNDFAGLQSEEVLNWAIEITDITPDPFNVKDKVGVTVNTLVNAQAIIVTGLDAPAPVTVTGAPNSEFLTNTNPTWRTTGFVNNNEPLQVRHRSALTANTVSTTTLCIGPASAPVCDDFNTTTADDADSTPNAFSFPTKTGLEFGVQVISQAVGITGFAVNAPATIDVGEFQIGGGPWVTSASVPPNSNIRIRHTTSNLSEGEVVSTLTVGGVAGTFTSRTGDSVPNAFSFPDKTAQPVSTLVESASVALQGMTLSGQARVANGEVSVDSGPWSAGPVTVQNGSMVRVRHTTAATGTTDTTTTLCVGPVSQEVCGSFVTTTVFVAGPDTTPDAFGWPDKNGVENSTVVNSHFRQIKGFEGSITLTIDAGQFQVNAGNAPWVTSAEITAPANIRVRHTSSASCNGSVTSTLTAGGVSGTYTTVTAACVP